MKSNKPEWVHLNYLDMEYKAIFTACGKTSPRCERTIDVLDVTCRRCKEYIEKNYWWCENCNRWIRPFEITYSEHHDTHYGGCGEKVTVTKRKSITNDLNKKLIDRMSKLLKRINMWKGGTVESVEVLAVAQECQAILDDCENKKKEEKKG